MILEKSGLPSNSIIASVKRLSSINIENIFTYKPLSEVDEICLRLNTLKKKSTELM